MTQRTGREHGWGSIPPAILWNCSLALMLRLKLQPASLVVHIRLAARDLVVLFRSPGRGLALRLGER